MACMYGLAFALLYPILLIPSDVKEVTQLFAFTK